MIYWRLHECTFTLYFDPTGRVEDRTVYWAEDSLSRVTPCCGAHWSFHRDSDLSVTQSYCIKCHRQVFDVEAEHPSSIEKSQGFQSLKLSTLEAIMVAQVLEEQRVRMRAYWAETDFPTVAEEKQAFQAFEAWESELNAEIQSFLESLDSSLALV